MFVGNELAGFGQRTGDGQFQFMVTALANLIKHSAALLTMIPIVDCLTAYKFSNALQWFCKMKILIDEKPT